MRGGIVGNDFGRWCCLFESGDLNVTLRKKKKLMDQSVYEDLTELVDALRSETIASSITPERLGAIIQQIIDILPELDDSSIAAAASSALAAAQAAATQAQAAIAAAQAAETAAGNAVSTLASMASDIATALSKATSAYNNAQTAAASAQQATSQVSALAGRVSNLETFRANTEHTLSKVPEYHSATWLESEAGVISEENPERRALVRYTSMKTAIEAGNKLIKLYNIVAIEADVNSTNGHLFLVFLESDFAGSTSVVRYRIIPHSTYCEVEKTVVPMPYYDATWAKTYGGSRAQLDEFINVIQSTPRAIIIAGNQPVVWAMMRNMNVVQFAIMLDGGMRTYTVEYSSGAGETHTTYVDKTFIE